MMDGGQVVDAMCGSVACPVADEQGRAYWLPMRADLTLLGIWLPAGESEFVLRYDPPSVRVGLWISGATLLLLVIGSLCFGIWRKRVAKA